MGQMEPMGAADWLAAAAPDPEACRWEWERSTLGIALLPAGRLWDVLVVGGELGRTTVEVLLRLDADPGPVLGDVADDRFGFFVPPGTAARWVGTGVRTAGAGTWVAVPHPVRAGRGLRWVVAPDGSGLLNNPVVVELALHEAAARLAALEQPDGREPDGRGAERRGAVGGAAAEDAPVPSSCDGGDPGDGV